jgi:hypothetical protein
MYSEDRSSDPFVADQLRKEKFKGRQLTELQVGMVVGKLDRYDYDIENVRLIHKRLAKTPDIAQRDFLQSAFLFKWEYFSKWKEFDFLKECMDWKTLWERVNYLYACECIELPIKGADERPYFGFFIGHKTKAPVGLTPEDVKNFDIRHNLWLDWKIASWRNVGDDEAEPSKTIDLSITLSGELLEEVLKVRDYHGIKNMSEAFYKWMNALRDKAKK